MRALLLPFLAPLFLLAGAWAQNGEVAHAAETAPENESRVGALKQVIEPLRESSDELESLRADLAKATSNEQREFIQSQIKVETERLQELRKNFRSILGGAEAAEYDGTTDEDLSVENLMVDLLEPLSRAVRDASATPRELDVLREKLAQWEERRRKCGIILKNIAGYQAKLQGKQIQEEFELARRFWEGREAKCRSQIGVLQAQIREREQRQRPALETLSESISGFFKNRGLNLLLALIAGILTFVAVRHIYDWFKKISPFHRKKTILASRVSDILAALLTILLTLWVVMLVFYIRGDWLMLTLAVLLLLGAVWAGKTSLPPYIEQVRTLLNLGSIREGERVIYEGVPWRVKSLGFLTILDNPNLQGGEYRIPVRHVMHMISRNPDGKEPWFPTEVDDWVLVGDGIHGKIVTQTPEHVVLVQLGGSFKTYATANFISESPENISHGYRVSCTFGIDYMHQPISTTKVPEIMELALTEGLFTKYDREDIRSIKAEFLSAGASSLDYQILVDVSGKLAQNYQAIKRQIQKICVDASNENGWVIPFTQITLHQAADAKESGSADSAD